MFTAKQIELIIVGLKMHLETTDSIIAGFEKQLNNTGYWTDEKNKAYYESVGTRVTLLGLIELNKELLAEKIQSGECDEDEDANIWY